MEAIRTILVGDVHGMLDELRILIEKVSLTRRDHFVLLGDIIDKGPDSAGVVKFLRGLRADGFHITLVLGNHEERHARYRRAFSMCRGRKVKMKGAEELEKIHLQLSMEDIAFLDSAVPYAFVPGGIAVHGGILPSLEKLPTMDEYASMSRGEREKFHRILRVRHVRGHDELKVTVEFTLNGFSEEGLDRCLKAGLSMDDMTDEFQIIKKVVREKGAFLSLGAEGPEDPFWADVYGVEDEPRFGHVYFGHSPYPKSPEPVLFRHATGMDLGCVFGGRLAAIVLEDGEDPRAIMVEAESREDWDFAKGFWE